MTLITGSRESGIDNINVDRMKIMNVVNSQYISFDDMNFYDNLTFEAMAYIEVKW